MNFQSQRWRACRIIQALVCCLWEKLVAVRIDVVVETVAVAGAIVVVVQTLTDHMHLLVVAVAPEA